MADNVVSWQEDLPLDAQQRREVFARFGMAAFQAQCVERQLGILLATTHNPEFLRTLPGNRDRFFDTESKKTLGRLVADLGTRSQSSPELGSRLSKAVDLRNWLAYNYFWERPAEILTWEGREAMIAELQEAADFLDALDKDLTAISLEYLERAGVSQEAVESEMLKYGADENA